MMDIPAQPRSLSLLDRSPEPGYLQEWQAVLALTPEAAPPTTSYLVFRLHQQLFAIASTSMSEVLGSLVIRSIPNRSRELLLGLVNLHGRLELCVSLSSMLVPGSTQSQKSTVFLVANLLGDSYVIPVQQVIGILRFATTDIDPPPQAARYLSGIATWRDEMVGLIDSELLQQTLRRGVSR